MDTSIITRLKALEEKNHRLKRIYADSKLEAEIIKGALSKKWQRHLNVERWLKVI